MFLTQTYADIGCPEGWVVIGMYEDQEDPHSLTSHGLGRDEAMDRMLKRLIEKHGEQARLLNVKVSYSYPAHVHPNYNRTIWRISGDLYLDNPPKSQKSFSWDKPK